MIRLSFGVKLSARSFGAFEAFGNFEVGNE